MYYSKNDTFRRHVEDITLLAEGGYMAKQKGDYETLFGLTAPNFNASAVKTYIAALPPGDFAKFPKKVHDELVDISNGGSPGELMKYIGSMLQPQTNSVVPGTKTHTRTGAKPHNGATELEVASIDSVKDFVAYTYEHKYCNANGFTKYPAAARFAAMDIAINCARGTGRANWTLVKAMRVSGLITDKEFNSSDYPYMTVNEAADQSNFAPGPPAGKGAHYGSKEMVEQIAAKLAKATGPQLEMLSYQIDNWRLQFYQERAKDSEYIASVLTGLENRIRKFGNMGKGSELAAKYANDELRGQFTETRPWIAEPTAEVAIEVPNHKGLIRYKVDPKTMEPIEKLELPEAVRWVNRQGNNPNGKHSKGGFNGTNTFIWSNDVGQEVRLPITPELNRSLAKASDTTLITSAPVKVPLVGVQLPLLGKSMGPPTTLSLDAPDDLTNSQSGVIHVQRQGSRLPYVVVDDKDSSQKWVVSPKTPAPPQGKGK